jgi:hypothetical protein
LASVEFPEVSHPAGEEATVALMAEATAQEADTAAMAAVAEEMAVVAAGALVDMAVVEVAGAVVDTAVVVVAAVTGEATIRSSSSVLVKRLSARPRLQSWDEAG